MTITPKQRAALTGCGWQVSTRGHAAHLTSRLNNSEVLVRHITASGRWQLRQFAGRIIDEGQEPDPINAALAAGNAYAIYSQQRPVDDGVVRALRDLEPA
jgi:hypothetical protein